MRGPNKTTISAKGFTPSWRSVRRNGPRCTRRPRDSNLFRYPKPSVCCGEALADVLRILQFVDQRNGVILRRNSAGTRLVGDQVVFADAEFAGALAWLNEDRRTERSPIQARLAQNLLRIAMGDGDRHPLHGKMPRPD